MPLLRNTDKSKISKRKNPAARLTWFREQGYLPEALRNFLALMGYSMPDNREVFTFDEMVEEFDWARVNTVGPVFDLEKLHWLNGHYIRELPVDDLATRIVPYLVEAGVLSDPPSEADVDVVRRATPLIQERIGLLSEAVGYLGFFFRDEIEVDPDAAAKQLGPEQQPVIAAARDALTKLDDWTSDVIEVALRAALVDGLSLKPKNAFAPVRVAVTGSTISPPLFESVELLGRERTLARLEAALR
jgi:glutamyl-tRNA synthetase